MASLCNFEMQKINKKVSHTNSIYDTFPNKTTHAVLQWLIFTADKLKAKY
jgi:hypothetical protein